MEPLRQEMTDYIRATEALLSIAALPTGTILSPLELQMIAYYADELAIFAKRLALERNSQDDTGNLTLVVNPSPS